MQSKWPRIKLGSVLKHRKEFVTIDDLVTYKRVTAKLHAKGIVLRDYIEGSRLKTKKQQLCKAGDFLVAEIDAKVGGFGIVPKELEGAIVSSHYFLFEIDVEKLERKFLDYFIRTRDFQRQISARGSTNYASIRPKQVLDLRIPLPPIKEQRRIVAQIESLLERIEEARKLRAKAIVEVEKMFNVYIKKIFRNPGRDWKLEKLGDISNISSGGTPPRGELYMFNGNVKWVQLSDITKAKKYVNDTSEYLSETGLENSSAKLYPPGTVLISMYQKIGEIAISKDYMATNQAIAGIENLRNVTSEYLYYFLLSRKSNWKGKGTAQRNINQDDLKSLDVWISPLSEQRYIVTFLDSLQEKMDELKTLQDETENKIQELIPSILDKAFKGEL